MAAWTRGIAVALDAAALAVFVLAGRQSHGIESGAAWFLTVWWPFLAGWFVAAAVARLYAGRSILTWRLAPVIIAGISIALLLRVTATQRGITVAFALVAYAFITLFTLGWRLAAWAVPQLTRRTGIGGVR
jgi:predicted anti-sigma-YlaC factor YlaD